MGSLGIGSVEMVLSECASGEATSGPEPEDAASPASRPSVLLVTVDTLRFDRLSPGGPMPRLRQLASRGIVFTRAHALVPLTLPSHATIMTSRGPHHHGVRDNVGYALSAEVPTVAEAFSRAGYATAAFIGGYPLAKPFGLSRGFDTYDDSMTRAPEGAQAGGTERRA